MKISLASVPPSSRISRSCSSYASPCEIAFWKIVGFEVTPTTASSRIIRASSPECRSWRERKSIQTLWPWSASWCSGLLSGIRQSSLHSCDLLESSYVALAAVEPGQQERADEVGGERRPHDLRAQAEHVHVVVLDALVRGVDVVADRGADSGQLAGRDRGADARAADEDGPLGLAARESLADLPRLVRVVDARGGALDAEVDDLVVGDRVQHGVT